MKLSPGTADLVNGLFQCVGAYGAWRNAYQLNKDKKISGVYWPLYVFYFCWGCFNLLYYPSLSQWLSFVGGTVLVLGNLAWVIMAIKLRFKGDKCSQSPR